MKIIKYIKKQDSGFKLSYGYSGETSINLSNEIFAFISQGRISTGEEKDITFRIYKEDYIKAMSFVIMKLPLYKSSSNDSTRIDSCLITFNELYSRIGTFFGNKEYADYNVNLYYRNDGRIYLKGLRVNGFSIRDYLVENYSALQFDDADDNHFNLRILSDVEEGSSIEEASETKQDVLRETYASKFLKEALKIVITEDANLSKLAALNKYRETNKQLKLNGYTLWRKKDFLPSRLDDVSQEVVINYHGQEYVLYMELVPATMEHLFFPEFNKAYAGQFKMAKDEGAYVLYKISKQNSVTTFRPNDPLQQIFYGAPGTGKSYKVKELTGKESVVRTTFHPDSDYSTFVGAYKPTSIEVPMRDVTGKVIVENGEKVTENRIVYEFVEQAFLKAYINAWKMYAEDENNPKNQYLVIEEINRGNCAQIFGDLFQLLDRGANGFSEYPINADKDMQKHLAKAFKDMAYLDAPAIGEMSAEETAKAIRNGEKLILPSNLYIWATMNTSDQSLFPIDSAFKRRWDWQYVPIHDGGKGWMVEADGKHYDWWQFVDTMNNKIGEATYSEDKKLGYFFCKPKDKIIDAETFVGKVIFYIWNDIFKDFADESGSLFKDVDGSMLSFNKFYTIGSDGKRNVVESKISILMQNLGVEPVDDNNDINGKVRYVINGETFKRMSYTGKEIMVKYLSEHKELTFQEIKDKFPDSLLGNVAHRGLIVSTNTSLDSYARYYSPEEFTSSDGITFKIYKQWTINNIDNIVNFAKEQGIDIRVIEE